MSVTGTDRTNETRTRRPSESNQDRPAQYRRTLHETKPSPKTTELWAMVAGIVALVVIYNVADDVSLTLWRTCLLATIIGAAYIVSRGIAKAGSHDDDRGVEYDRR